MARYENVNLLLITWTGPKYTVKHLQVSNLDPKLTCTGIIHQANYLPETNYQLLGNLCVNHNLLVLSDEVYEFSAYSNFDRIATFGPGIARRTLTLDSAGKTFNVTGWRVGWLIGDKSLLQQVLTANVLLSYTTAGPPQIATAVGFEKADAKDFWNNNRNRIQQRSQDMCEVLQEIRLPASVEDTLVISFLTCIIAVLWTCGRLFHPR